jgi:thioredoxin-dependent peroxiredoxin
MLNEGDEAPNVALTLADGSVRMLSDTGGLATIVYFYPKDDTTGCTKEAQEFSALAGDFAIANARVIGVSKDSMKSHVKFAGKYDLSVALASDESGAVCEAFGVWVEKSMYGRNYMGIERSTFLIDAKGVVRGIWRKVKVAGHAAAVLESAKSL